MAKKIICKDCKYNNAGICEFKKIIEIIRKVEKAIEVKADKKECEKYVQFNNELQ